MARTVTKRKNRLKVWELALLLALCAAFCVGVWAKNEQAELSEKLIRLHVVAVSDDETEQAVKLRVRDAVLEYLAPLLEDQADTAGAAEIIEENMDGLTAAAAEAAEGRTVAVTIGEEDYPTREYETFSLPAGRYTSLRVTLGAGEGRNWWCVVFPPLCMSSAVELNGGALEALSDGDVALITEDGEGYVLKFKLLELWGWLQSRLEN